MGFSKGLLLLATNYANIERVPLQGIVGVEFESLLVLSRSSRTIPVVLHLVGARTAWGRARVGSNSCALRAAAFDFG